MQHEDRKMINLSDLVKWINFIENLIVSTDKEWMEKGNHFYKLLFLSKPVGH